MATVNLSSIITPANVLTASGTATLTNKTIAFGSNTLTDVASLATSQTLTNKTINIASNTLTGVQSTLVSGTSIKTINSTSLLGSGDIALSSGLTFLSTVNATSGTTVTITITGSYSSYLLTGYKIGTNTSPTTTDLSISVFDTNTYYDNGGTWTQSSKVLNNIGNSAGGSSFNLIFNGLTDTNSNTKIGSGTGYGYYSGVHCISVSKSASTAVSSIEFTLSGGVTFDNGVFKLYGIT